MPLPASAPELSTLLSPDLLAPESAPLPASARVLLLSTYELGHQPLGLAAAAAALRAAGHRVDCLDLAVEPLDEA
ncbi:MAG: hypothetical protein O2895_05785, partial [Chloroflexi bacterium]|nr:hypothetical protein [Chloroflexota bacterium]